ncbi:MAG: hypothetical protein LBC39_06960 [Methanobrevibacter sp.]|jgi:hypothetical protein|nr:hypothetical protein [Candidatus Methanovirga aequatorialis]
MGIAKDAILGLCHADKNGFDFENVVMIGRQSVLMDKKMIYAILEDYDLNKQESLKYIDEMFNETNVYAEGIFKYFGAKNVDSIDYSDFEGANITHDMNVPTSDDLKNKYTIVFDGGTLEHVFNYPIAIKNAMDMVKIGGHLILITPANNHFGHGFYQFSPELFFSLLSEYNGFTETYIFIKDDSYHWYEIRSPKVIKHRTDFSPANHSPTEIIVFSKKIANVPDKIIVFQSDYLDIWDAEEQLSFSPSLGGKLYRKTPNFLKPLGLSLKFWYDYLTVLKKYYKPVKDFSKPKK